jgi:hypothetical protein
MHILCESIAIHLLGPALTGTVIDHYTAFFNQTRTISLFFSFFLFFSSLGMMFAEKNGKKKTRKRPLAKKEKNFFSCFF